MEFCDDSPIKKKRKNDGMQNEDLFRQCIIHVCQDEEPIVSKFSEHSWKVGIILAFCLVL